MEIVWAFFSAGSVGLNVGLGVSEYLQLLIIELISVEEEVLELSLLSLCSHFSFATFNHLAINPRFI